MDGLLLLENLSAIHSTLPQATEDPSVVYGKIKNCWVVALPPRSYSSTCKHDNSVDNFVTSKLWSLDLCTALLLLVLDLRPDQHEALTGEAMLTFHQIEVDAEFILW